MTPVKSYQNRIWHYQLPATVKHAAVQIWWKASNNNFPLWRFVKIVCPQQKTARRPWSFDPPYYARVLGRKNEGQTTRPFIACHFSTKFSSARKNVRKTAAATNKLHAYRGKQSKMHRLGVSPIWSKSTSSPSSSKENLSATSVLEIILTAAQSTLSDAQFSLIASLKVFVYNK